MDKLGLANAISYKVDATCQKKYDDGHRNHLGASLIGHECSRYLWYVFRWAFHKKHSGQLYRLFNRGHKEEERIVEWLRDSGFVIREFDADGKQFCISDCGGHFGGSTDGECQLPFDLDAEFDYDQWLLTEYKTMNDVSFKRMQKSGVIKEQPKHYAQMCTYGFKKGYKFALYVAINKNTDHIYYEIVELDHEHGKDCVRRAENVINSQTPPKKLAQQASHFKCKYCDFSNICHNGRELDRNCRSCKNAEPVDNAEWMCNKHGKVIPKENLKDNYECWESIQEGC